MEAEAQTTDTETPAAVIETPLEAPPAETQADVQPTEDVEAAAEGDVEEAVQDEGDPPHGAGDAPSGKHKRSGGYQRKIERLERQNMMLLEQLQRTVAPPTAAAPKEETPEEKAKAFLDGLVDKRVTQMESERGAKEVHAKFQRRMEEVKASTPDFNEVMAEAMLLPEPPPVMRDAILTSEKGPEIMLELARNPDELARISALPPLLQAREVGRLEAQVSGASPKATPKVAPRKPPAPAPITPVNGRGTSTVKRPDQMSYEEYRAWREAQRKPRR